MQPDALIEPSLLESIHAHWTGGGAWMYPIAAASIFAIAIVLERFYYLFMKSSTDKDRFVGELNKYVLAGDVQSAVSFVAGQRPTPLANVVKAGLIKVRSSDAIVQSALDEATLRELPKLERRTGYLAVIGNVATLLGLLGTIGGLIKCFAAVSRPGADPTLKSAVLANGIAEAMNCTAFGLIVAIPSLVAFAVLNGRTQQIVDEIHESAVTVLNLVVNNRDKLKS
ncbi:MAG: MotA/TolQ/ExbB proton channel family protein [Clostridia bacterium]|nr:MotA/TolQ/ExbB proton channel family protein [Deltaproteobacteria bacterium]